MMAVYSNENVVQADEHYVVQVIIEKVVKNLSTARGPAGQDMGYRDLGERTKSEILRITQTGETLNTVIGKATAYLGLNKE
jgi:hypothetical protein